MAPEAINIGPFLTSNIKKSPGSVTVTNERKINKWITGNRRGIDELVKKYNSSVPADLSSYDKGRLHLNYFHEYENFKSSKISSFSK